MSKKKSKRKSADKKMMSALDKKFTEFYGDSERFGNETIVQKNVAEADVESSLIFGANKNLYRVIPNFISGLRPGATRMIYAWWESEGKPTSVDSDKMKRMRFKKGLIITSNTMKYHPHGDAALQELLGTMGQYWSNNIMMIVPQGSYGNVRGDEPGNGRYIEAKLSEYTIDCFFDEFDKYNVPMKPSYTGDSSEPEFLPAKYPHILFNPQFAGIGWGSSSNIPSFNIGEVLDATIKLIKDPTTKIMLIPDIPTGCDIIDDGLFKDINKTGKGKITMRAAANVDYVNNIITFTALPLNVSSQSVISKIIKLKDEGVDCFGDIVNIDDYSQEGEARILLYLKKDAKPDKVLSQLYKKGTGLKSTLPVNITVIDDYESKEYGVKKLLLAWIEYREDIVRSMMLNKLQSLLTRQHTVEVLTMLFNKDNIDDVIKIAKTSNTRQETIERLMKKFKITSMQAGIVADMKVHQFNKDTHKKYVEEKESLKEDIKEVQGIITDEVKLGEFIIKQLEEGKKKYAGKRRSKVVKEDDSSLEDIPDTEHLIGISDNGFVKKVNLKKNTSIGPVGKTNSPLTVMQVNNRENVLIVDESGLVSKISISAIPNMEFDDIGFELNKLFSVQGSVKAIMELPTMDILNIDNENIGIIFVTKKGLCKKVKITEIASITDKKQGIILNEDDSVAAAIFQTNDVCKDIVIYTNQGTGIRLPLSEVRSSSLASKGVSMISLKNGEEVVNASLMNSNRKLIFFVTSSGRCKVVETKYFPTMNRKDKPVNLIALDEGEFLVGLQTVNKNDVVIIYKKKSEPEQIEISSFVPSTRVAPGKKVVKTGRGDIVTGFKVFTK